MDNTTPDQVPAAFGIMSMLKDEKTRNITVSATTAGGLSLAAGVTFANTDGANRIIDALVRMLERLDPTVALMAILMIGLASIHWLRMGQMADHIAKQYDMLSKVQTSVAVMLDRRKEAHPVDNERRVG